MRIEGEENEVIAREEYLVLRIENGDRAKVGHSENERMGKAHLEAYRGIENRALIPFETYKHL